MEACHSDDDREVLLQLFLSDFLNLTCYAVQWGKEGLRVEPVTELI